MAKVLIESEVATIGGTSTSYGNRCCTKARAEELGCTVTEPSDAISNLLITGVEAAKVWVPLTLLAEDATVINTTVRQPKYNSIPIYAVAIVPFSSLSSYCRLGFSNLANMTINTSSLDTGSRLWCHGDDYLVGFEKTENGSIVYWSGWNNAPYRGFEEQIIKTYDDHTVYNVYVYENNNPSKISEYDKFSASPMYFYVFLLNALLYNYYVLISKDDLDYVLRGGRDYVEIGGLKWATMNVGANSVTDIGLYFQWGDTQGYTAAQVGSGSGKKNFGWADYNYGNGTSSPGAAGMTKYNSSDGKTVLETSDDSARANWGGAWRMPTTAEYVALGKAVNTTWTTDYQGSGVAGLVCTDKTDSSKVLFFPAASFCYDGSVMDVGRYSYWSSSVLSSDVQNAYSLTFFTNFVFWQGNDWRCLGFPVRGVIG